ncbi:hypothetical protein OJ998_30270 [Solirubrobacter taibaiensis]|nr:hypothetical protein [Solirubrobacter taibaiensis]
MKLKRSIAALGAATALVFAGCGAEAATTNSANGTAQQGGQPPQGGGMDFSALATKLGVTTEKLQAAMAKNRPEPGTQGQPPAGNPGQDMAANLAQELGLDESKVQAALDELMPQGGGPDNGQAPPSGTPAAAGTSS